VANLPGPTGRCPKAALARILDLVDWEGAAVLAATQIFHLLEFPIRDEYHNVIPRVSSAAIAPSTS